MYFRRVRPSLRAFLDHCGWGPASRYHPGRGVSKGVVERQGERRRERWKGLEELGRAWEPELGEMSRR
jgi:hypothetical protein